jgi:AraC-like DNA-binding protein
LEKYSTFDQLSIKIVMYAVYEYLPIIKMPKKTDLFANTTVLSTRTDVLDEALRALDISGSLLLRENYSAPWGITIPKADALGQLLHVRNDMHVVAFHLVEFGHCEIQVNGSRSVLLTAGDIVICFGNAAHTIGLGHVAKAQPVANLLNGAPNACDPAVTGKSISTSLICGVFQFFAHDLNPLISALPPLLHLHMSKSGELHNLSGVARLLTEEIRRSVAGSSYITERLLEVLCAESVRAHFESAAQPVGWFRGLKDPTVGRAMANIHATPGAEWTVSSIAGQVAMSPSRLAAKFVESMGISPMAYVAQCRMNLACQKLASSRISVEQVANDVGYESAAAFNRAFKKHLGYSPAAWRVKTLAAPHLLDPASYASANTAGSQY